MVKAVDTDGDGVNDCDDLEPNSECDDVDENGVAKDSDGDRCSRLYRRRAKLSSRFTY